MKFFKRRLFRSIVTIGSLILIVSFSRGLYSLWKKKDIITQRQEALARLEKEQQELQKKLEQSQSPEFIEQIARDKLGMIKEGEKIVLVPKKENSVQKAEDQTNLPNWKQWWKLFF